MIIKGLFSSKFTSPLFPHQPLLTIAPITHNPLHPIPERSSMMRFNQMHQLVNHHILNHGSRQHRHTERENINLPCVRMNPNGSLARVPARSGEKLQHA